MSGSAADRRFEFTAHAVAMMAERAIERSWVERTVLAPDQTEPDPSHPDMVRRFWTEGAGHENDI
ncbi:DUF4258 domain-containing protein [Bosea sp. F3-2]|uniref:DUF4258 domain-containing protein n=1 Tax=Bosea sp. F3-2 TaxID=2599640 RepID=UPI0020BDE466|nr:DUF4258 domain-containing protein [Bosea sp. F3-2]